MFGIKKRENDCLLEFVYNMPQDIKNEIYSFLPERTTIFVKKNEYIKNHETIRSYIPLYSYESYIRDIIRKDCDFVFGILLKENFMRWINFKSYTYKNFIFSNYVNFLSFFCINNESNNCKNKLDEKMEESGLSKNQHKKNIIRNIRWKN